MCATTKYVSVRLKSTGAIAWSTPVSPPIRKMSSIPIAKSIGVLNEMRPPHIVPIQLKNLMPVGTAISHAHDREERQQHRAGRVHVVRPDADREPADRERREDEALVAEHRPAREHREHLGDDPEERQGDDVHLGMAEEPEHVLPQDRRAVLRRLEDVRVEMSVAEQHRQRGGEHRERQQHEHARHEHVPRVDRHAEHRHARARAA